MSRIPNCLDNRFINGGKVVSLTRRRALLPEIFRYSFLCRLSKPRSHGAAGRIRCIGKESMTPSGVEPATFRLVGRRIRCLEFFFVGGSVDAEDARNVTAFTCNLLLFAFILSRYLLRLSQIEISHSCRDGLLLVLTAHLALRVPSSVILVFHLHGHTHPRSVVVKALCYKPEGRGFMTR
jgi:hypothetical protein